MRILLIGPRGSGKSTVAAQVAQRLGLGCVDADLLLERRAGQSIREIFAAEGEAGFRDREEALLAELCQVDDQVIATGGGVVLRPGNRQRLRQAGLVVWLTADVDTLWQRIRGDQATAQRRPNLSVGGREEVAQVLAFREPLYRECAHLVVDTAQNSPEQIADRIIAAINSPHLPHSPSRMSHSS